MLYGKDMEMEGDKTSSVFSDSDSNDAIDSVVDMDTITALSEVTDTQLAEAALDAVTSGKLTPLIKVELRSTIQAKRLSEGKDELEIQPEPVKEETLTEEEIDRRQRRRERNKVAAQKCRHKRKIKADGLHEESVQLEHTNQELRSLIQSLEKERQALRDMITSHEPLCVLKNDQ